VTDSAGDPLVGAAALRSAGDFDVRMADGSVAARLDARRDNPPSGDGREAADGRD